MRELVTSGDYYRDLVRTASQDSHYEQALAAREGPELPPALRDWLGRLRLLYGVPFEYLVPNEKLLPRESIRFFYMDRNWTDRLVDGALSVGKTTTRDYAHHHQVNDVVRADLDDEERTIRLNLRGDPVEQATGPGTDLTGMLMRSRVVSGWPGLEVKAYDAQDEEMTLLRMDRPAPDILFCLFHGVPKIVDIEEPREGIQMGVDVPESDGESSDFELKLRYTIGDNAGWDVGNPDMPDPDGLDPVTVPVPVRRANRRVIHVKELAGSSLPSALRENDITDSLYGNPRTNPTDDPFPPASLAVQMLQFPYRQRFEGEGRPPAGLGPIYAWGMQTAYTAANFVAVVVTGPLRLDETILMGFTPGAGGVPTGGGE